jgi:uncharacterized protein YdbL (DUF1318 family)
MTQIFSKFTTLFVILVSAFVFAPTLSVAAGPSVIVAAKNAGQIGEQPDGYLGIIDPATPEAVKRAVRERNIQRKAAYGDVAHRDGSTIEQVAFITAEKNLARVKPGQKYMDMNGHWVTK